MNNITTKIKVWDAPVRVFHWLLVLSFVGAYLSAESERWRLLHISLGYTLGGLVAFRLVWGLIGTRYARFASFVRGPAAVRTYLRSMLSGQTQHFLGHNPAGAVAIILIFMASTALVGSGWAVYNELGGEWLSGAARGRSQCHATAGGGPYQRGPIGELAPPRKSGSGHGQRAEKRCSDRRHWSRLDQRRGGAGVGSVGLLVPAVAGGAETRNVDHPSGCGGCETDRKLRIRRSGWLAAKIRPCNSRNT